MKKIVLILLASLLLLIGCSSENAELTPVELPKSTQIASGTNAEHTLFFAAFEEQTEPT